MDNTVFFRRKTQEAFQTVFSFQLYIIFVHSMWDNL